MPGGGRIKSVQRGTISLGGASSATATITAVDVNNSVLRYLGSSISGTSSDQSVYWTRVVFTNATTITGVAGAASAAVISFEVIEYFPGAIKSVQRGTVTNNATATISAVDTTKTELSWLGQTTNFAGDSRSMSRIVLTNATTVTHTNQTGDGGTTTTGYQVVEFL